jgi:hypothetical protein
VKYILLLEIIRSFRDALLVVFQLLFVFQIWNFAIYVLCMVNEDGVNISWLILFYFWCG